MSISTKSWEPATTPSGLGDLEVHLWRAELKRHKDRLSDYAEVLSDEERVRAERFRFDRDRNLYVLSRGVLRLLLSAYSGRRAHSLAFRYGSQGKPFLDADAEIEFNISHSGELCVMAFARRIRVGVDIEQKSRDLAFLELAERFFAADERNEMSGLDSDGLREAFYAVWTRKEAYIKGLGEGVTHGLDNFAVTVGPDERHPRVRSARNPDAQGQWNLFSFEPETGYAGALAVEGSTRRIKQFEYSAS